MILVELIYNLSLIIALSIVSGFLVKRYPRTKIKGLIVQGLLFGIVAIVGMIQSFPLSKGLIFDGRSIVISLATLFFGPISGLVAGMISIIFRIFQGGSGILPGTLVVISSIIIGSIFHFRKMKRNEEVTVLQLYFLGFSVHIIMLLMMFSIPFPNAISLIQGIGIPVILIYPLATVLIGKILSDQEVNVKNVENIKISELKFRSFFESSLDAILLTTPDGETLSANSAACKMFGYTEPEFINLGRSGILDMADSNVPVMLSERALNGKVHCELTFVRKDGTLFPAEISSAIFNNHKGLENTSMIIRDITERKFAEEKLIASELRYRRLFESAKEGILIIDAETGKIVDVNPFLIELLGYPKEKFIEKEIWEIKLFKDIADNQKQFLELQQKEYIRYKDLPLETAYGRQINVEFVSNVYLVNNHKVIHCNIRDITESLRNVKELIEAKDKAEENNRLKTNFLANMSHELRTPLIGILGYAEFLENELMDVELIQMAKTIKSSGQRLNKTLNNVLDISRIESEKQQINFKELDLLKLLDEQKRIFQLLAGEKGLTLNFQTSEEILNVNVDEEMFVSIITNLLNNAIKYTETGSVTLSAKKEEDNAVIEVKDTGIGVSEDLQAIIFEPFRQASEGYSRTFEGTGLGLTLVKKFTDLMGGSIILKSKPGEGSTFRLTLPISKNIVEELINAKQSGNHFE
jgi:PAS domain S-box-containing protein